jgi:hypothetical protein
VALWRARLRQLASRPARYYGGDLTIHRTTALDVELHDGRVVAVWFRCQQLPFNQIDVNEVRAGEMAHVTADVMINGVEVVDPPR